MTEVVNYSEALERAGGSVDLAKELFAMLLKELPVLRKQLRAAIDAQDLAASWDHAHKIYGSTAYCAVPMLHRTAQATEAAIKAQDLSGLRNRFEELEAAIETLLSSGPDHLLADWQS